MFVKDLIITVKARWRLSGRINTLVFRYWLSALVRGGDVRHLPLVLDFRGKRIRVGRGKIVYTKY